MAGFDVSAFQTMYAASFANDHVLVDILLSDGTGGYNSTLGLRAFVSGYSPQEMVSGDSIQSNDTKCIILGEDLPDGMRRLERKDRIRLQADGKLYSIMAWDDKTRRIGDVVLAVNARLRG